MDKILERLPESMLWVAVALVLAQIVVPNIDKIVAVVRRENNLEAITRDVPALIERRKVLSEAGYTQLAGMITIYLNGVVAPKTLAQLNKESDRQIAKYQSFWVRNLWGTFMGIYLTSVITYYLVTQALSDNLTEYLQGVGLSPGLASIAYLLAYAGGFLALNSISIWAFKKLGARGLGKITEAQLQWKRENGIPIPEAENVPA